MCLICYLTTPYLVSYIYFFNIVTQYVILLNIIMKIYIIKYGFYYGIGS